VESPSPKIKELIVMSLKFFVGEVKKVTGNTYILKIKDKNYYFKSNKNYPDGFRVGIKGKIAEDLVVKNRLNIVEVQDEMDELSFKTLYTSEFGADRGELTTTTVLKENDEDGFIDFVNRW
jgi:hypothetical protein